MEASAARQVESLTLKTQIVRDHATESSEPLVRLAKRFFNFPFRRHSSRRGIPNDLAVKNKLASESKSLAMEKDFGQATTMSP